MQTLTFSSASATLSTYQPVELPAYSASIPGTGNLRVTGFGTGSAGNTADIELALVRDGVRVGYFKGVATLVAQTTGSSKMFTFAWDETSNSKIDLLGSSSYSIDELAGSQNTGGKNVWYIGVPSFDTMTAITLELSVGPV